jgi:putative spermidine/putrescine transport system ATP-binding protein
MAQLQLDRVSKRYGHFHAVRDVSIDVAEGEFVVLLGPSGCGKTTTLRIIAGFVEPTAGAVSLGGTDVTRLPPWKRNTGLVFQSYALFPHLTVNQNVAFGLEMRGVGQAEIAARVEDALRLVRLGDLGDRLPRQLSGGQQQRVALARALVFRPDVLLLDEPLSNLDAKLRQEVRVEIRDLQRSLGITTVMVTHDQEEALTMADRLVVMSEGTVRQIGTQRDLYERPTDSFVAGFVGRSSFIQGEIDPANGFRSQGGLQIRCDRRASGPAVLALRPERVTVAKEPLDLDNDFTGKVEFVSYLGGLIDIHTRLSDLDRVIAQVPNSADTLVPAIGDPVHVGWAASAAFLFQDGGTRLEPELEASSGKGGPS